MQDGTEPSIATDVPLRNLVDFSKTLQSFIAKNLQIFGGADIYNTSFQNPECRAGTLVAVLIGLVNSSKAPVVKKFVVVLPPGSDRERSGRLIFQAAVAAFRCLAQREFEPREQEWLRNRLQTVVALSQQSRSVLDIISAQAEFTTIIVTDAASYRDAAVDPYIAPEAMTPLLPEDFWAPHLHALASESVKLAENQKIYVAIDANEPSPSRPELCDLLASINDCGVLGSHNEDDSIMVLSSKAGQWDAWIRQGHLGQVLRDIGNLPSISELDKRFLRIQMLHRARQDPLTLQELRELLASDPKLDGFMRVKLARIAQSANAFGLAVELLSPCIDELNGAEDLDIALLTAHETGPPELEERVAARLEALFPESPLLRQRRLRALLTARNYARVATMYAEQPGEQVRAEFYQRLANALSIPEVPDYQGLIALAGDDYAQSEAYRMACVDDALARKLLVHAFHLVWPLPTMPTQVERGERLLLQILTGLLLHTHQRDNLPVSDDELQGATLSLIESLSAKPNANFLRFGLAELVQPSVAGNTGLALMVVQVLQLASRRIRVEKCRFRPHADARWIGDHMPFIEATLEWLKNEEPIIIGRSVLPESLMTERPDEAVSAFADYLTNTSLETGEDASHLLHYLALASAITPHCSDPDYDLELLRVVAGQLANSGQHQLARDLAEQAIQNSAGTPRRRRLGWFVVTEVYHRCHNYIEALIALACTFSSDAEAEDEHAWLETMAVIRILRDCGLRTPARTAIAHARNVLEQLGFVRTYSHRLDAIELQLRHQEMNSKEASNADLEVLLNDVVRNAKQVLEHTDATAPAAAMLGQLITEAKNAGVTLPPETEALFAELCTQISGSEKSRVGVMTKAAPSADELLGLLTTSGPVRYSDDVGYDMHDAALLAARSLANDAFIANATDASFALELLSDRGVGVPHWDEAAVPPPAPKQVNEPADIAITLSKEGLNVLQVGFDALGRLVRTSAVNGVLQSTVRENGDVAARKKFLAWAQKYPFNYGTDDKTPNLFYITTAGLVLPKVPTKGPVVVVGDVAFQAFPPNLLYFDEEFAGRVQPMAAAPSLLWLQSARIRGSTGDRRFCAWISTAAGRTETQTLSMLAQRLSPTFDEYNFIVSNEPVLPTSFAGASVAVVGAHGGVHPDGRFFQTISDEGKLRVAADDLANSLRNIDVIILFVCSGGRSDKHPEAVTVLGMAKQILDRGCSAVIASPWPLDPRVAYHWLPIFLKHWSNGSSLIEANFAANQIVDHNFSQDTERGLAMTILGNPSLLWPNGLAPPVVA